MPISLRRRRIFVLTTLLGSALFAVAGVEIGLRALRPSHTGIRALLYQSTLATEYGGITTLPELIDTTFIGYRPHQESDGYVLNARSLRTHEYATPKAPGTLRIVALGDSFTYGGVPDADHWCNLLERRLAERTGSDVEVLRMGMPGTGPPFYLRMWEIEAAQLKPDLVVTALFVGNDFFDEQGRSEGWRGLAERAAAVSYSVRLVRNMLQLRHDLSRPATTSTGESAAGDAPKYDRGGFERENWVRDYGESRPLMSREAYVDNASVRMSLCRNDASFRFASRLQRVVQVLRQLHDEVIRANSRFLVMIIPDEYQVHDEVALMAAERSGLSLAAYDRERPQRELTRALSAEGIAFLDLLPAFRERAPLGRLYATQNLHWNRAGHKLGAERLLVALQ